MGSKEGPKSAVIHLVSFDSDIPCSAGFCEKMIYQTFKFSVNEVADTWGIFGV